MITTKRMIETFKHEIHNFFSTLNFEKGIHTYTVKGRKLESVSSIIKNYYTPFDAVKISERKAEREGTNPVELRKQWKNTADVACDFGHNTHDFAERYPYDNSLVPSNLHETAVKKFWDELPNHIVLVNLELRMYHRLFFYAGTADVLLYDLVNNVFIIADFKTNKDLFKNFKGQKMIKQFSHLLDTPYNHYQLQLSLYQILIEQLSYKVSRRVIIWLKPEGTYELYDTQDYTAMLINDLKNK
jgi:hypothetical protein